MPLVTFSPVPSPPPEDCFCLDPLNNGESVLGHGKHMFHKQCLRDWALSGSGQSDRCPKCLEKMDVSSFFPWTDRICRIFPHAMLGAVGFAVVTSFGQKEWIPCVLAEAAAVGATGILKGKEVAGELTANLALRKFVIRVVSVAVPTILGELVFPSLLGHLEAGMNLGIVAMKVAGISGAIGASLGAIADRMGWSGGGIMRGIEFGAASFFLGQIAEREELDSIAMLLTAATSGFFGTRVPFSVDAWQVL